MWTEVEQCTIGKSSDCYMIRIDEGEQRTYTMYENYSCAID